jgi:hypothetical protein
MHYSPVTCLKSVFFHNPLQCRLQSVIEEVRQVTLSRGGFRQVQIDVELLRGRLWQYSVDDR